VSFTFVHGIPAPGGRLTGMRKLLVLGLLAMLSSVALAAPSTQGQANGERGGTPRAQQIRSKG